MAGIKKSRGSDERLDKIGREVVRASAANESESEAVASSPFLYTRVRSRIAELGQREEIEGWLATIKVIWRAIPALTLVAVFAFALFLYAGRGKQPAGSPGDYALLDGQDASVETVVYADARSLSPDDVLASIMGEDEQEASR